MEDYKYRVPLLIHNYLSGVISENEKEELFSWIQESEENRSFFDEMCGKEVFEFKYEQYKNIDNRIAFRSFKDRVHVKRNYKLLMLKYAASILLPLGFVMYFLGNYYLQDEVIYTSQILPAEKKAILVTESGKEFNINNETGNLFIGDGVEVVVDSTGIVYSVNDGQEIVYNKLITPRGGEFSVTLDDGTKVFMNSGSELKYPISFNSESREVYFSGEAYFEVAKDSEKVFYVVVDDMRLRVYGTSFNINSHKEDVVETVLISGDVGISSENGESEYRLKPNQLAEFSKGDSFVEIRDVDVNSYTAWREGYFVFEDNSLGEIVKTLSLWYDIDFVFTDETLRSLHFTGHLKRYDNIDTILRAIGGGVGVLFNIVDKVIYVSK